MTTKTATFTNKFNENWTIVLTGNKNAGAQISVDYNNEKDPVIGYYMYFENALNDFNQCKRNKSVSIILDKML